MLPIEAPVPDTKPATERIAGVLYRKVSPRLRHAVAQRRIAAAIGAWADFTDAGGVGTEWEFRLQMPDGSVDTLVPDVAYLSYARGGVPIEEIPIVAPDLAVEIRSLDESRKLRELKIERYLAAGTLSVWDVDPATQTIAIFASDGRERTVRVSEIVRDDVLPGFSLDLRTVFSERRCGD